MQSLSTLETTVVGFVLAVVLGVVIAIGIVSFQFLDRTLYSLLVALNAVPKVALAPLFIIWLGTGSAPKIAVATLIAIFPILIDAVLGLKYADPRSEEQTSEIQSLMRVTYAVICVKKINTQNQS